MRIRAPNKASCFSKLPSSQPRTQVPLTDHPQHRRILREYSLHVYVYFFEACTVLTYPVSEPALPEVSAGDSPI